MDASRMVLPVWQPLLHKLEDLGEDILTIALIVMGIGLIWLAFQKDHLILKAVIITYILTP